jgi:hypothetical protein
LQGRAAMNLSFSAPRRLALMGVVASLLLFSAVLAFAGCGGCRAEDGCHETCSGDTDCADGEVCAIPSWETTQPRCLRACSASTECPSEWACVCGSGASSGRCDLPDAPEPDELRSERVCAGDLTTERICRELCVCPCSFGDHCPGGHTGEECRTGCEAAYADFPGCQAELGAYYACAYRKAVCAANADVDTGCIQGYPYCWGVTPEDACPTERSALAACTQAQWGLFYPTK